MRYIVDIQLLFIALAFITLGVDNGSLIYGQTSQNENYQPGTSSLTVSIENLKVGHSYLVNVESNGCFHHSNLYLTISRENDGYFAKFTMKGEIEGRKVNTKFKKTKLSDFQIDSVRNFERQLVQVSALKHDCTTVDQYTLAIDKLKTTYTVDKCDWQGIGKLVETLFRKTE
jgi:hypothetical protein